MGRDGRCVVSGREMLKLRFKEMLLKLDPNPSPEGLILQGLAIMVDSLKQDRTFFDDVEDFHRRYQIQYDGQPRALPEDVQKFRDARLAEEFTEYGLAVDTGDLEGQVDALIDLCYIAFGTIHLMGVRGNLAWGRVHEANMRKELSSPSNPGKHGSKIDIVKPPGWKAPDHSDLLKPRPEGQV